MGNRILKESVCVSEQIDGLGWFEEVFFYRLLVNCDDYGVMDARPKILKAKLFPLKEDVRSDDMVDALITLVSAGLIRTYTADGKPYLQVIKWSDHQRVRDSKHKYPAEADCESSRQVAASCGELRQNAESSGSRAQPRAGAESESESESESISESESSARPRAHAPARTRETDERFDAFWKEYPNKQAKKDARKAWDKLKPDDALVGQIMTGLRKWNASEEWKRDDGRYIPHPATWLNGQRWEDEISPARGAPSGRSTEAQQYQQRDYTGEQEEARNRLIRMMNAQVNRA